MENTHNLGQQLANYHVYVQRHTKSSSPEAGNIEKISRQLRRARIQALMTTPSEQTIVLSDGHITSSREEGETDALIVARVVDDDVFVAHFDMDAFWTAVNLPAKSPWIPCSKRLPPDGTPVLAIIEGGKEPEKLYYDTESQEWGSTIPMVGPLQVTVTHWMPLPELPK